MTTKELAKLFRKEGACSDAQAWIDRQASNGVTLGEGLSAMPAEWDLWSAKLHGDTKRLDECAEQHPWVALKYSAHLLTPSRLDKCAERRPDTALERAAHLLTPERKQWCEEQTRSK